MKHHEKSKETATRKENKGDAEEDRASEMCFEEWVRFIQGDRWGRRGIAIVRHVKANRKK